jgi:hypothetical protein
MTHLNTLVLLLENCNFGTHRGYPQGKPDSQEGHCLPIEAKFMLLPQKEKSRDELKLKHK